MKRRLPKQPAIPPRKLAIAAARVLRARAAGQDRPEAYEALALALAQCKEGWAQARAMRSRMRKAALLAAIARGY